MATDAKIESIFYARFHDEHGPRVFHQVPEGSVIPSPSPTSIKVPFFDFQSISTYIIPNREFCNRPLSVCSNGYRILGHPVCISDSTKYERNDFIFNFCVVVDEKADYTPLKTLISKLARTFGNLEEQDSFLSKDEQDGAVLVAGSEGYGGEKGSKVFAVVEMVFEDLRAVGEAMIPIDESNTLNLCLFPTRKPPPSIQNHHVPLSVARFGSLQTSAWDLTIQQVIPHINGIHSVARIAQLADTDISLTRRAVQHLVYYDCLLLLDIFTFAAIYAPTPSISTFVASEEMQDECRHYIYCRKSLFGKASNEIQALSAAVTGQSRGLQDDNSPLPDTALPSRMHVINLYTSLRQSLPLRDFCLSRSMQLNNIDIRRFITFGIIKGIIYRVHRYAVLTSASPFSKQSTNPDGKPSKALVAGTGIPVTLPESLVEHGFPTAAQSRRKARKGGDDTEGDDLAQAQEDHEVAWRIAALSSGWRLPDGQSRDMALGIGGRKVSRMEEAESPPDADEREWQRREHERHVPDGLGDEDGVSATTSTKKRKQDREILKHANGSTSFDALCTELSCVERDAMRRMSAAGDVVFITK
ncbi:nitrogen permease regulator 2-domain-containing protein [Elsinoe ampelina]|uniref:Nitrogen permease regulator 2-domain-containing protein n=1 Tax=Elsinoe ampelina TaxID=302913 RepID=A0A6A6GAA7_9PEZI|nr:nitrogen permease regulator 2-domain-containing protein [Elsinoe ampelina]